MLLTYLICGIFISPIYGSQFSPVTDKILAGDENDILAAFGDFDADKLTDIVVIHHAGQQVDVLLQRQDSRYERKHLISISNSQDIITGVMLADFNGDVSMDILLTTTKIGIEGNLSVAIYFGPVLSVGDRYQFQKTFIDQPLVFDYNGDMMADLLTEHISGVPVVYLATGYSNFTLEPFTGEEDDSIPSPFLKPHSNAFIDLDGDLDADLLLTTEAGFEQWIKQDGHFQHLKTYNFSSNLAYVGQSSFADFNQDGEADHLVPVCKSLNGQECDGSALYMYSKDKWYVVNQQFTFDIGLGDERSWQFVPPQSEPLGQMTNYSLPAAVRVGDYNIDGYPDILVVMASKDDKDVWHQRAFILANFHCLAGSSDCNSFERTFVHQNAAFSLTDHILMAAFFDLYEDGRLDVLLVGLSGSGHAGEGPEKPHLIALSSSLAEDACFIKVLCVSGRCSGNSCAPGIRPYGVNVPGPTFSYKTTRSDRSVQRSIASQLTQSAYFPLQLPFNIFGLGPTPNFVERLDAGIPSKSSKELSSSWTEIIPNSQLIVIPNPIDDPTSWTLKLFVTPSKLVYYTGTALVGTCGLVAIVVGILHWREKREDLEEKKQEAQKFHFDAM